MAWTFRYKLVSQPAATADGSGTVIHDILAEGKENGDWLDTGVHQSVVVPAAQLSAALASGTNQQKTTAYKGALAANVNTQPVPIVGLSAAQLEQRMEANKAATAAAGTAHTFITVTLGLSYPVSFNL